MKKLILSVMLILLLALVITGVFACKHSTNDDFLNITPNLKIENNLLSWDKAKDADGYMIFCDGVSIDSTIQNTYKLETLGENLVKIKAYKNLNDKMVFSNFSNAVIKQLTKLNAPILQFSDGKIYWNEIANTISYELSINEKIIRQENAYFYLEEPNKYSVSVKAIGDMILFNDSAEVVAELNKIVVLNNPYIEINQNIVRWTKVSNATRYKIFINGMLVNITDSLPIETEFLYEIVNIENVELYIIAYGENDFILSEKSNAVFKIATQLEKPIITLEKNVLKWDSVENAIEYLINNNGTETKTLRTEIDLNGLKECVLIKVSAIGNPILFSQSEFDSIEYFFVPHETIAIPQIEIIGKIASWTVPLNAESFKVFVNDIEISPTLYEYEFIENIKETICKYEFKESIDETISIIAVGKYYLDSNESAKYHKKITKINIPSYTIKGNEIRFTNLSIFELKVETNCQYSIEQNVIIIKSVGAIEIFVHLSGDTALYSDSEKIKIEIYISK